MISCIKQLYFFRQRICKKWVSVAICVSNRWIIVHPCVICIIYMYGVYHLHVWCVSFTCMVCIIYMYGVYHLHVWCASFTCMVCIIYMYGVYHLQLHLKKPIVWKNNTSPIFLHNYIFKCFIFSKFSPNVKLGTNCILYQTNNQKLSVSMALP
jgi:hypothetical protein